MRRIFNIRSSYFHNGIAYSVELLKLCEASLFPRYITLTFCRCFSVYVLLMSFTQYIFQAE